MRSLSATPRGTRLHGMLGNAGEFTQGGINVLGANPDALLPIASSFKAWGKRQDETLSFGFELGTSYSRFFRAICLHICSIR